MYVLAFGVVVDVIEQGLYPNQFTTDAVEDLRG